tara:strand:+ start:1643 stop:2281 length:639 start_codon:yes stop_codon:yes gene_type:complete
MTYTSSKVIELGSTAFRQPNADSHCKYLHGYQLKAELTFGCEKLDNNNWVFDFGGLKQLKEIFNNQFDHTTVISGSDPELDTFKELQNKGIIQLRILDGGVGIEKFAEWVFKTADTHVEEVTEGRVWVENVTVYEHKSNFASVSKQLQKSTLYVNEEGTKTYVEVEEKELPEQDNTPEPDPAPQDHNPRAAQVGNQVTQGKGNWFAGTSWGD